MKGDSIFGVEPKRLKKLAALGLGPSDQARPDAGKQAGPSGLFMEKVGDWIGPYELLKVLGEGGMGIVYLARQHRPIRRQVAIKLVKPGMDSRKVMARFEAEQQALAVMDHPHVAHVHDAGLTAGGRPYFVMEYVEGIPITEHCDRHKLTVEKRLELFLCVCQAIQHAHYKGIIHRDIKPSNILVSIKDGKAAPKIIDFGIAKALTQPLIERTFYTEQGQFIGTPEYMSPEQAFQSAQGIDTRTDVYSLGVVLYELLAGVLPFDAETLRGGGPEHLRRVIQEQDPKTPSTRLSAASGVDSTKVAALRRTDVQTLGQRLHGDLDWITLKAMEKEPDRRYATVHALAEDIRRHLNNEPVSAGSPSLTYRLGKFLRRNRTAVAATVASLILMGCLTALLLISSRAARQGREARMLRDRDTLDAAQQAFSERRLTDALELVVPLLDSKSVGMQAQLLQANILVESGHPPEAQNALKPLLDSEPQIAGVAHALLARILWEGDTGQADAMTQAAFHRQEAQRLRPETAEAFYLRALTALTVKETLQMLEKALSLDPRHYPSRRLHAHTLWASERYQEMRADALALIVARPADSLGYFLRGAAQFELKQYEQALADIERALAVTSLEADRRADLLDLRCRSHLALSHFQEVIEEASGSLTEYPDRAIFAFRQFCALLGQNEYDRATAIYQQMAEAGDQAKRDFQNWSMKYVFDSLAAGRQWHGPAGPPPQGVPFAGMHEADIDYREFSSKARRLISRGFGPRWSPDGTKLAYGLGAVGASGIAIYDLKTGQNELLIVPGDNCAWSPDGQYVAFGRNRQRLDMERLATVGHLRLREPRGRGEIWIMRPDGSEARRLAFGGWHSWSADGRYVFYKSPEDNALYKIAAHDRQAQPQRIWNTYNRWPSVSPDGRQVAIMEREDALYIWDLDGSPTAPAAVCEFPDLQFWGCTWAPSGDAVGLVTQGPRHQRGLWMYDVNRRRPYKLLSGICALGQWSPDGQSLAFVVDQPYLEIWVADREALGPGKTPDEHCRDVVTQLTQKIAAEPTQAAHYLTRAQHYARLDALDEAITDAEKAAQISGSSRQTARWLAQVKAARREGRAFEQARIGSSAWDGGDDAYTLVGSGGDIWGNFDECHFTYAALQGDGAITARIDSLEPVDQWTKAGIMIRETLTPHSAHVSVLATPSGRLTFARRTATGDVTQAGIEPPGFVDPPHWIRLTRRGNLFAAEHSSDAVTWQALHQAVEVPMSETVYLGLAVSSHHAARTAEARFSEVRITGSTSPDGPLSLSQDLRLRPTP